MAVYTSQHALESIIKINEKKWKDNVYGNLLINNRQFKVSAKNCKIISTKYDNYYCILFDQSFINLLKRLENELECKVLQQNEGGEDYVYLNPDKQLLCVDQNNQTVSQPKQGCADIIVEIYKLSHANKESIKIKLLQLKLTEHEPRCLFAD